MSLDRQKREEELNFKEALNRFQQNPSDVTKLEIDTFKIEIESLYDYMVASSIQSALLSKCYISF